MEHLFTKEDITKNLIDIGCNNQQIKDFINFYENKNMKKVYHLLKIQRCYILNEVHEKQKKIDDLDYLVYMLKKEENTQE